MSIASHVRRVPLPSRASDVDKFLDDLFDPVWPPKLSLSKSSEQIHRRNPPREAFDEIRVE